MPLARDRDVMLHMGNTALARGLLALPWQQVFLLRRASSFVLDSDGDDTSQ